MADCFDPLHHMDSEVEEDIKCTSDDKEEEIGASQGDQASGVLHWSAEHVENWLKQSVPFEAERLQDFVYACRSKSVDGLSLLTLQRSHLACEKLTDSEWLILKIARRRLLTRGKEAMSNKIAIEDIFGTSPSTPKSFGMGSPSGASYGSEGDFILDSDRNKSWNALSPPWDSAKDDQLFALEKEVQSLRGEIVGAEEREITLQAKLDHLDQVLRTSRMASYLKTRTSWMAFPGDASYESSNVDGWLQRFLVLQGSCIYYYLSATDLRPQGTILLSEIVEIGQLRPEFQCGKETFSFHITNCHGFRLECCSSLKYQLKAWLKTIRAIHSHQTVEISLFSPSKNLEKSTTLASWLDAAPQ